MKERSLFTHVGPRIYRLDEFLLIGYAAFLILNLVGGILALSNGWSIPSFVWAIFQWGNGLCGVLLGIRCMVIFILYKGAPPRAELQMGTGLACGGALFWLLISQAPVPNNPPSLWGFTPVILLGVVIVLLTVEIMDKGQHAQATTQASSPALSPQARQQKTCGICHEPTLYDICNRCRGRYKDEWQRIQKHLNRARQANELATLTLPEWIQILDIYNHRCAYCHIGAYEVLEHRIPIGQGNAHRGGTTAMNCVPACRSCNATKSNRHPHDQPASFTNRQKKKAQ